jgi:hypothetical protein
MLRLFRYLLLALALVSAATITNRIYAQSSSSTPTPSPSPTNSTGNSNSASPLPTPRATGASTSNTEIAQSAQLVPTTTTALTATVSVTDTLSTGDDESAAALPDNGPLEGTILANRSQSVARFFLEGQTYEIVAGRSQGLQLPRASTVLNLFNCDGALPVDTAGCYWDPYLLQQEGFYEIYDASVGAENVQLLLREAGTPPSGLVWVQNRTEKVEQVVFREDVFEIQPTTVAEFPVATGVPAILYVRSCLSIDNQSACEWAPKTLDPGVYYAMIEVDAQGTQSTSTLTTIDLRPVVGAETSESEIDQSAEVALAPTVLCSVVVPALNVRSGPGLQYDIIGKVRTTDSSAGTVSVTGRSADSEWLTVDPTVTPGGWINNSSSFITCGGDPLTLPVVEAPAVPTPLPNAIVNVPVTTETVAPEATGGENAPVAEATSEATATSEAPVIPDGQALLVVNNGFQHEMRFTLDQRYRTVEGPSEIDLQPGQSVSFVVFAGDIAFTASSPWSGLSGNASIQVEQNQSLTLWLRFEPEPTGNWVFRWN